MEHKYKQLSFAATTAVAATVIFLVPKLILPGGNGFPTGILGTTEGVEETDKNNGEKAEQKVPEVKVEFTIAELEKEQKSVDAGHSPWKLDPVFVTQVFASLLLSPEGIVGDYPIPYEDIELIENDGTKAIAIVKSKNTLAEYVYLERLVRQDETGIWTVVGYDKR